jgi:hypothetical protein
MEYIKTDPVGSGEWLCLCGNTALDDGFYPCNEQGEEVEPTREAWTTNCYVCTGCGRIIRQSDRLVMGFRAA